MKVKDLIKELSNLPQDADVWHIWDGEPRTEIKHVWLSIGGEVMTADDGMVVYSHESRPEAESMNQDSHWYTPGIYC